MPCCEWTNNIKVLAVAAFLFQLITAIQFFFAIAANSNSLMADCIAMQVDVITYLGNLYAEAKRQTNELTDLDKAKISLIMAGISIAILFAFTCWFLHDAIETLIDTPIKDDLHPAWYLILFGGLGFTFDLICLWAFSIWGDPEEMGLNAPAKDKDAGAPAKAEDLEGGEAKVEEPRFNGGGAPAAPETRDAPVKQLSSARSKAVEGTAVADEKASAMTMCSALSHVFADCIRSFTTVCVGIAAVGWKNQVNGAQADSIGALVCSATIFFLALGLFQQWFKALKVYLNYDRYEHTELARPSTRAQGIARILSAATTYDEVQK
jgi:Co/Zn/Cd efflux system component